MLWGDGYHDVCTNINVFYMLVIKWSIGFSTKDTLLSASCKSEPFPALIDGE